MNRTEKTSCPGSQTPSPCPICRGPMERFTVTRARTGEMQGIRCPECKTSSFLSRDAANRLAAQETSTKPVSANALEAAPQATKQPTSLFEDLCAWLADGIDELWK